MDSPSKIISKSFIKPKTLNLEKSIQPYHLSPMDYMMISMPYIRKGLLFLNSSIKSKDFMEIWLQKLRDSLAETLVHFYPLAGRLSTSKTDNPRSYVIFVDCNESPGAGFIHAKSDLSVADIVESKYVPLAVQSFFDHDNAVNHDGHTLSLLSVQVTELKDGIFIGISMNHSIGDGSSFWHFFNSWSEIFNSQQLKNPPVLDRWFPQGYGSYCSLPFTHPDEFIKRYESQIVKERIFHISSETIQSLKSKVNQECQTTLISSFQSLTGVIWKYIIKGRKLSYEQQTRCAFPANNRSKMIPPLSMNYFGNCVLGVKTPSIKVGDLLENDFGWAALKVHQAVNENTSEEICSRMDERMKSPFVLDLDRVFEPNSVQMGNFMRFKMYECEFGLGKAVAVRTGDAGSFNGRIRAYMGREGDGSIDLEVTLVPQSMEALESEQEFMSLVSS